MHLHVHILIYIITNICKYVCSVCLCVFVCIQAYIFMNGCEMHGGLDIEGHYALHTYAYENMIAYTLLLPPVK
jgi:hypothetical protein